MILKLRMIGDNGRLAYRLIDNIKTIEYKFMDEPDIEKLKEEEIVYINSYPELPDKTVVEIWIKYENGFFEMMYTDNVFYIMNNNGKTCDTYNG